MSVISTHANQRQHTTAELIYKFKRINARKGVQEGQGEGGRIETIERKRAKEVAG